MEWRAFGWPVLFRPARDRAHRDHGFDVLMLKTGRTQLIDVIVTQRVHPGKEQTFEALAREITANTLAKDKGCLRHEWYRSGLYFD